VKWAIDRKLLTATALSLCLLALGCGKADRDRVARVPTSPTAPDHDPQAVAKPPEGGVATEGTIMPYVRIAELEIDPAQLEGYTAAVKEEMDTSVRVEAGVLAIYAVAEKDNPDKLRFFEMYADEAAYRAHIESPHFKKYAATTKAMIVSRKLIDTVPVQLSAKAK
jgi:quinol monooxygenase YgiN